jgi:hypothetical protein
MNWIALMGENMIKGAKVVYVKVLFQGLHMTNVIFILVYNFIFYVLGTPFYVPYLTLHVKYKYKLILFHVYYAFMLFIT